MPSARLTWAVEKPHRVNIAFALGSAIHPFWINRGYLTEALRWMEQILELDNTPSEERAYLLMYASSYAGSQGDYARAQVLGEEAMTISRTLGDERGIYDSLSWLATLAGMKGDYLRAAELLDQVLVYQRNTPDEVRLVTTLNNLALALALRRLQKLERAKELYAESIALTRKIGNYRSLGHALHGMGEVHVESKDYASALKLYQEGVSVRFQLHDLKGLGFSFDSLAICHHHLGENTMATRLESAGEKQKKELGVVVNSANRAEKKEFIARLRAQLGDAAFERAWAEGQAMSVEETVALAMGAWEKKTRIENETGAASAPLQFFIFQSRAVQPVFVYNSGLSTPMKGRLRYVSL